MGQPQARWNDRGAARQHVRNVRLEIILQSAARCFNRKGYQATKMGDIARELGVSKAALYYYVKSKEEIIFRLRVLAEDPQTLQQLGETFGVSRERVRQLEQRLQQKLERFLREQLGDEVLEA